MARIEIKTFKQVEEALNRLALKSQKVIVGLVPMTTLYQYSREPGPDGHIFRYLFPISGRITRVVAYVPGVSKDKPIPIHIEMVGEKGQYMNTKIVRQNTQIDVEYDVELGDRLVVMTDPECPSSFEIGVLFYPKQEQCEVIKTKLDALEETLNERVFVSE